MVSYIQHPIFCFVAHILKEGAQWAKIKVNISLDKSGNMDKSMVKISYKLLSEAKTKKLASYWPN